MPNTPEQEIPVSVFEIMQAIVELLNREGARPADAYATTIYHIRPIYEQQQSNVARIPQANPNDIEQTTPEPCDDLDQQIKEMLGEE